MSAATSQRADTESPPRAWPGVTSPVDWAAEVSDELGGAHVRVAARARTIRPWLWWTTVAVWILPSLFLDGDSGNGASIPGRLILFFVLFRSDAVITLSDRGVTVHRARQGVQRPYRQIPLEQLTQLHQRRPADLLRLRRRVWRVGQRRYCLDSASDAEALAAVAQQLRAS